MQVSKKVFVVTGGGNGIGREVVLALLTQGAAVAAVDISEEGLAGTVALVPAGAQLTTHALNIADRIAIEKLPEEVLAAHGTVDGLINVAGIIHRFARVQDLSLEEIERVIDVNFWGTVYPVRAFLPLLLERPEASLVNVASMAALVAIPGQTFYGASKAAVQLFTEGLYSELRDSSIAVTVVLCGGVATSIVDNSGAARGDEASREQSSQKLTSPEDAAGQIVDAVTKGSFRIRIGGDARMVDRLTRLMPQRATALIANKMKSLLD